MRELIVIFCVLSFHFSHSQYFDLTPAYMSTLSSYNPANSGFNSKLSVSSLAQLNDISLDRSSNSIWAIGDVKWKALHGGVGINYNHFNNNISRSNTVKFNYNYQMKLSENQRLSIGLAAGLDHVVIDEMSGYYASYGADIRYLQGIGYWDPSEYRLAFPSNRNNLSGGMGLIYQFKQLEFGFSANNFMEYQLELEQVGQDVYQYYWTYTNNLLYNTYLDYRFRLFKWLDMNPTFAYQSVNNSRYNLFMTKLNFIIEDKMNFGFQIANSMNNVTHAWFQLGCRIKNRFGMNYSYGVSVSRFTNQSSGSHLMGLTYSIDQN